MKARQSQLPSRSWLCGRRGIPFNAGLLLWLFALAVAPMSDAKAESGGGSPDELKSLMDMSLDQLLDVRVDKVYGASKYEQKISQAPSSVSIVTSDEIKKQGHRTLAEILRSVRGLFITDDRAYSYLGIRGFGRPSDYNSRVLLLVDGHRMNDNIYDSVLLGTEGVIDVDLIERVEVIRGPSSSIYGDNAFFGVINIITRPGNSYGGVELSGEVGGFETYKGRFSFGNRFTNGIELVLSGTWSESAGESRLYYREFDAPTSNNGIAEDSDGDRYYRFFGKVSYGKFTLSGAWSERTKDIPTASFGTIFNDGGEQVTDRYAYADLKYEHTFSSDVTVLGKVYYDSYKYTGDFPFNVAPPANPIVRVLNRDVAYGDWAGVNWQLTAPVGERAKVVVGTDFRGDLRQHQLNYDVSPRAVYLDDETASWNTGVYAQGELAIRTNLLFSGGVRFDYYDTFGSTINPRLSLIYSPWFKTNFKLLYGQAYRAPNIYELNSRSLDPETIHTYELVYEQDLPAHLRFIASGYYYQVDDLISETLSGFQNAGQVNAKGLELELEGRYARGLKARLSYALQRSEDDSTGSELSNSPRQLAKGSLIAPLYKDKIFAGLELQYTGSVLTNTRQREDDYLLANVTLFSQNLAPGLELSASIYNLFDARYAHPVSAAHTPLDTVEQSGRSFRVKLTYKF
jgi:iron complex outermembrane receptor protein